jgi:hypothetical protein
MGIAPAAQPTNINVTRQANGVLSFSGVGGGDGTGAVQYSGLPNWTSKQGGAGMGAADFGGQAFKPAQVEIAAGRGVLSGEKPDPMMNQFNSLMDAIGRGVGGPVGVADNKMQLQALAPLLERQMAGKTSTNIATMETETRRRGQDLGLEGEMARVGASVYGTDVGAQTAEKGFAEERYKANMTLKAAQAKVAAGKPTTTKDKVALFVFAGLNADGTPRTPEQQAVVERRYASSFGNRDSLASLIQASQAGEE